MATILCVDDEPSAGVVLEHTLTKIGHRPVVVASVDDAMKAVARIPVDLVIADYLMPKLNGLDLLRMFAQAGYSTPVIVMTGYAGFEDAVVSMKSGAIDYLTKPIRAETLEIAVNRALEQLRLRREIETLRSEIRTLRSTEAAPVDAQVFDLGALERMAIGRALQATGGNRTRAAKLLGISERTLRNKLNRPRVAPVES